MNLDEHFWNMSLAVDEAYKAYKAYEVPIGAVIISKEGVILSKAFNTKEKANDPCGHAEILAIRKASKKISNWRLTGSSLYVTLEPCPMCLNAMIQARIRVLVFGCYDSKGGSLSLNYKFYKDNRLNHNFSVVGGIRHYECSKVLSDFFKNCRKNYSSF